MLNTVDNLDVLNLLGHGPFSHLFDSKVINRLDTTGKKWRVRTPIEAMHGYRCY